MPATKMASASDVSVMVVAPPFRCPRGLLNLPRRAHRPHRRCSLEMGPMLAAAVWGNEYSQYWQAQFDALAGWL